jgi:hypothetical protein
MNINTLEIIQQATAQVDTIFTHNRVDIPTFGTCRNRRTIPKVTTEVPKNRVPSSAIDLAGSPIMIKTPNTIQNSNTPRSLLPFITHSQQPVKKRDLSTHGLKSHSGSIRTRDSLEENHRVVNDQYAHADFAFFSRR